MKIMLIGAAGYVGRFVLKELLDREIKVTAVIKSDESIKQKNFNLRVEKREILDPAIEKMMEEHTAIITSGIAADKGIKEQKLIYKSIISKLKDSGKKYIMILFEMSMHDSEEIKKEITDVLKEENDIEWSIFIIPKNSESGEKKGNYGYTEFSDKNNEETIFIEDIADAVVDEIEKRRYIKKEFTIEYL